MVNKVRFGLLLLLTTLPPVSSWAQTPSERHQFHVSGRVQYRCYAGYGSEAKNVVDDTTQLPCDNQSYTETLIDKVISVDIRDEPDPLHSTELAGSWSEIFEFKGRKFEIAVTLFKELSPSHYRIRLMAADSEPTSRKTAVFTEMKTLREMNPLSVHYSSSGKKEEVDFWVEVKFLSKKKIRK